METVVARAPNAVKIRNHDIIVAYAAGQICKAGLKGLNVADAMRAAGLTHGGFYKHFANRDALVHAAIARAFDGFIEQLTNDMHALPPGDALQRFVDTYLSDRHLMHPEHGCPFAALASEVATQDAQTKSVFEAGTTNIIAALDQLLGGLNPPSRIDGATLLSILSGAVTLARVATTPRAQQMHLNSARSAVVTALG